MITYTHTLIGGERLVGVHPPSYCHGTVCPIHNPTHHHMEDWPQHFNFHTMGMERRCWHNVMHPDPDDQRYYTTGYGHDCCIMACCVARELFQECL